jgi:hypothetical protein
MSSDFSALVQLPRTGLDLATPVTLTEWVEGFYKQAVEGEGWREGVVEAVCDAGEIVFVPRGEKMARREGGGGGRGEDEREAACEEETSGPPTCPLSPSSLPPSLPPFFPPSPRLVAPGREPGGELGHNSKLRLFVQPPECLELPKRHPPFDQRGPGSRAALAVCTLQRGLAGILSAGPPGGRRDAKEAGGGGEGGREAGMECGSGADALSGGRRGER